MISPSRKLFYVVEAMVIIAYNAGQGAISSRDIAARQGLPPRYLEQLMQRLVRAGLVRGMRGPHGGYVLAKERRRITIADINAALGEEKEEDHLGYKLTQLGEFIVKPIWGKLDEAMLHNLKQINLADLCEQAEKKQIRKKSEERTDFII
jgi:Rrf2 family transcriptional regulator, iron-sulfur cluster assembly transcription factor